MDFKLASFISLTFAAVALTGCPGDDTGAVSGDASSSDDGGTTEVTTTVTPTTTSGASGLDSTDTNPSTTGPSGDSCCEPHATAGCNDTACSDAVCEMSAFCCAFEWGEECSTLAGQLCGVCGGNTTAPGTTTTGPDPTTGGGSSECCDPQRTPGCIDADLEMCVCAIDSFCCDMAWDEKCVGVAVNDCMANCEGGGTTGGGGAGDCCTGNGSPGCDDATCEAEVCAVDAFCCNNTWDGICADQANGVCTACGASDGDCCVANPGMQGCGDDPCVNVMCGENGLDTDCCNVEWTQACADQAVMACGVCGGMGGSDCCAANGSPGCDTPMCEMEVCAQDDYCCMTEWDFICGDLGSGMCDVCGAGSGDCCNANPGEMGCSDDACVNQVCGNFMGADPTCCNSEWTQSCADQAAMVCAGGCAGGGSDCCVDNGTPGCDTLACVTTVCGMDADCCAVAWDAACAALANANCAVCMP